MLVLAAVRSLLASRLQRAARHRFDFHQVHSWEAAVDAILRQPLEIAVADPGLSGEVRAQEIERIRVLFPSLPIILYTTLSPDLAPTLLRLGQAGIGQVVMGTVLVLIRIPLSRAYFHQGSAALPSNSITI